MAGGSMSLFEFEPDGLAGPVGSTAPTSSETTDKAKAVSTSTRLTDEGDGCERDWRRVTDLDTQPATRGIERCVERTAAIGVRDSVGHQLARNHQRILREPSGRRGTRTPDICLVRAAL